MLNSLIVRVLQNLLFCVPKAAVLHGKSVGFASQKSRFRNVKAQLSLFNGIIFTKLNRKTPTISLVDKSSLVGKRISIGLLV
ncbi:MAG: hypothetical protein ACFNQD_01265 [Prevotella intermedia]